MAVLSSDQYYNYVNGVNHAEGIAWGMDGYISCYRPDIIYRYTSAGDLQVLAEDFEGTAIASPTNVAFCGKDFVP